MFSVSVSCDSAAVISHNAPAVPGGSGSCVATSRRPVHSIGRRQLHSLAVPCIDTDTLPGTTIPN
ncbi:hypothetical protein J6590_006227 [Homalodisca vitripennis]|nr:hypothetical protein J6590_006227 [Homalodisca vitripennis]